MFESGTSPLSNQPSLSDMEESLREMKKLRSDFEKNLERNAGVVDTNDPVQNAMYAFALYSLWAAFSESIQASGPEFGLESELDAYAFDEATKYEREAFDRFGL